MKSILPLLAGAFFLTSCAQGAAEGELGMPAPELQIQTWIKGEPVKVASASDKSIYVVEFWATWCPPCRTSIPHLTEVQKRFKDKNVVIIGISDEDDKTVRPFVDKMGDKMNYHVATDDKRKTSAAYMKAFNIGGIPHAFIVQNQKVIWEGHPMDGLDSALEEITAGKYDIATAKARSKASALYDQFREAVAEGNDADADKIAAELQAAAKGVKGVFPNDVFDAAKERKEVRKQVVMSQLYRALAQEDNDAAAKLEKELKEVAPEADVQQLRDRVAVGRVANKYFQNVSQDGDKAEAAELGKELAAKAKGNPEVGNSVAWTILTQEEIKNRDVPLALQIAKQACEDSKWNDPQVLDTYARALFDSGKKAEAIDQQKKAIEKAEDDGLKQELGETLKKYQQG